MKFVVLIFTALAQSSLAAPPVFEGISLANGKSQKIEMATDKIAVALIFLSSKCPCSHSHIPEIKKLARDFPMIQFIAVHSNGDETFEMAKGYFEQQKLSFPVLHESEKATLADHWKALKTPHVYVLSKSGEILYKGGVTDSAKLDQAERFYLREALNDVSNSKQVRVPQTRVLGCTIERGEKNVW